ncbi:hypothetical protein [Glaciimonas sp. PAMC28666]|uniref:hypothetical protein n=1 Tax=Glaciimonas sp. PAMC28666 TaxID=2807626 RepID=UPI001965E8B5|nr:hypothetical protein [Glaciimonas sp. PAMC28666]QRX82515.1 hypothetical protein JQN73_20990 [Glaciimonas sp. PAMC28666]
MKKPAFISRTAPLLTSVDFGALLKQGIRNSQQLGGDIWTDYNEHDPGVTILEQLCYAMTDLGLRIQTPMPDLLAPAPQRPGATPYQSRDALFGGEKILTSAPLTINDYRKLLYDQCKNLKNVWLKRDTKSGIQGLYAVQIETFGEEVADQKAESSAILALEQAVQSLLNRHRNLGEDFLTVHVLEPLPVWVEALVEIDEAANPTAVLGNIMDAIQNQLIPYPHVTSSPDAAIGASYDAIFCGPKLELGIIDDTQLCPLPIKFRVEDVARIITSIAGVIAVGGLCITVDKNKYLTGDVPIEAGTVPRLAPSIFTSLNPPSEARKSYSGGHAPLPALTYPIVIRRKSIACLVDSERVFRHMQTLMANRKYAEKMSEKASAEDLYLQPPAGTFRDLGRYYSIQHHFPVTYGIGDKGVRYRDSAPEKRKKQLIQARQLKTYLLFFEQILTDYCAQIAHAGKLFSLDDDIPNSYFSQALVDGSDAQRKDRNAPPDLLKLAVFNTRKAAAESIPPKDQDHYVVYLKGVHPLSMILLVSREAGTQEEADKLRSKLMTHGAHSRHYHSVAVHAERWHIVLNDEHGAAIAFGGERFATREAAQRRIARLAHLLENIAGQDIRPLLTIKTRGVMAVHFNDLKGRRVLSAEKLTVAQQKSCVVDLLEYGVNAHNFRIINHKNRRFHVMLCKNETQTILSGVERFGSHALAVTHRDMLVEKIGDLCCDLTAQAQHIQLLPAASVPLVSPAVEDDLQSGLQAYRVGLARLVDELDDMVHRRNRFLDHLLARVGEAFDDVALSSADPRSFGEKSDFYSDVMHWKLTFLRHYDKLSSRRSSAYDYTAHHQISTATRSGLENRLFCLLGLLGNGQEVHPTHRGPVSNKFSYRQHTHYSYNSKLNQTQAGQFVYSYDNQNTFQSLLKHGIDPRRYNIKTLDDGRAILLFNWPQVANHQEEKQAVHQPQVVYRAINREQAHAALKDITQHLGTFFNDPQNVYVDEELILLEHVLLRPQPTTEQHQQKHLIDVHVEIDWEELEWEFTPALEKEFKADPEKVLEWLSNLGKLSVQTTQSDCHRAVLYASSGVLIACDKQEHPSESEARRHGARLARHVAKLKQLPRLPSAPFYSMRLSLFFPEWPIRFQNHGFRDFAERSVRENCPAHLAAQCYWLSTVMMAKFKRLHGDWMQCKYACHAPSANATHQKNNLDLSNRSNRADQAAALNEAARRLCLFIQRLPTSA